MTTIEDRQAALRLAAFATPRARECDARPFAAIGGAKKSRPLPQRMSCDIMAAICPIWVGLPRRTGSGQRLVKGDLTNVWLFSLSLSFSLRDRRLILQPYFVMADWRASRRWGIEARDDGSG